VSQDKPFRVIKGGGKGSEDKEPLIDIGRRLREYLRKQDPEFQRAVQDRLRQLQSGRKPPQQ
jgi:hypothetical protein